MGRDGDGGRAVTWEWLAERSTPQTLPSSRGKQWELTATWLGSGTGTTIEAIWFGTHLYATAGRPNPRWQRFQAEAGHLNRRQVPPSTHPVTRWYVQSPLALPVTMLKPSSLSTAALRGTYPRRARLSTSGGDWCCEDDVVREISHPLREALVHKLDMVPISLRNCVGASVQGLQPLGRETLALAVWIRACGILTSNWTWQWGVLVLAAGGGWAIFAAKPRGGRAKMGYRTTGGRDVSRS
ncbi:hypothetical protein B0T18DRAFT_422673 [Schizothecium vesticola]|uniref:Uncharacterized protein n=1 Tax=Schizothecium vesticola TaxID=314040 RepID=A0AA40BQV0_9PEZI|nr:hypothetical protein B0T18DRAFT_422673 [Schizothecium vesticola]